MLTLGHRTQESLLSRVGRWLSVVAFTKISYQCFANNACVISSFAICPIRQKASGVCRQFQYLQTSPKNVCCVFNWCRRTYFNGYECQHNSALELPVCRPLRISRPASYGTWSLCLKLDAMDYFVLFPFALARYCRNALLSLEGKQTFVAF